MMRMIFPATLLLALAACGDSSPELHGYAEGKFVMLAPETAGRVTSVGVAEGSHVTQGTVLFQLEDTTERAALEAARANAAAAASRFDDAAAGGRAPEIAAAREQLNDAQAAQIRARADRERAQGLFDSGTVARARLDEAIAASDSANARVSELRQRLTLATLPARENQVKALESATKEAEAQAAVADDSLRRRRVAAPAAGRIERIIRYAGDVSGPSLPVVRFLPDGDVRAVMFIPEALLAQTPVGTKLAIACDGCPADAKAAIVSVASESEFTPPVIYSDAERSRLVFRAEAKFDGFTPSPGTPLRARVAKP